MKMKFAVCFKPMTKPVEVLCSFDSREKAERFLHWEQTSALLDRSWYRFYHLYIYEY